MLSPWPGLLTLIEIDKGEIKKKITGWYMIINIPYRIYGNKFKFIHSFIHWKTISMGIYYELGNLPWINYTFSI